MQIAGHLLILKTAAKCCQIISILFLAWSMTDYEKNALLENNLEEVLAQEAAACAERNRFRVPDSVTQESDQCSWNSGNNNLTITDVLSNSEFSNSNSSSSMIPNDLSVCDATPMAGNRVTSSASSQESLGATPVPGNGVNSSAPSQQSLDATPLVGIDGTSSESPDTLHLKKLFSKAQLKRDTEALNNEAVQFQIGRKAGEALLEKLEEAQQLLLF